MNITLRHRAGRALFRAGAGARIFAAVALAGALTAACDVHGFSEPGTLKTLTVTPNATLSPAGTQQMTAVGLDADGRVVPISPTWAVVAGGGSIGATGLFTAGNAAGSFPNTVQATAAGVSATASITVVAGPVASITVTPTPVTLGVSTTQQFIAVGKDAGGNIVQFTPSWSVVAGGGTITQAGIFTAGGAPGTYTNTVQASSGGIKGFATVIVTVGPLASLTVTPNPATMIVGAQQQFVATGKDASGNTVAIAATWSVVAGGGTIDGAGLFTAGGTPGTFTNTVKATSGSLSATATVVVTAGPLARITVTPNPATLAVNGTQQFTAVGADVAGNPVTITPVWSVVAGGGAINTTGLFTAGTISGTYTNTVRATSGGLSGYATVIVTTGPLASITVTPNPIQMPTNSSASFVAVGTDANGNVFVISPVWSVANGGGSIDVNTGVFTSTNVSGTFTNTIKATSGTVSGYATVTVTPVLTTITVTPNPASLTTGTTQAFTATGRDAAGNLFAITPVWSVNPLVGGGTINATTGLFTAGGTTGTFTNAVVATSGAVSGSATVTVTAPVLTTITVTPNPATLNTGTTQTFTAAGIDNIGNPFAITPIWSVVNGGGTINSGTGVFTAGGTTGTFNNTVKATTASGLVSGFATVTVTTPPLVLFENFGAAAVNGIMAGASVTCSGTGQIFADIAISPGSTISGFPPCTYSGVLNLGNATSLAQQVALTAAYNNLMGQACPAANNYGTVDYASRVLPAGVYCSASSINVTGTLTLDGGGDPNAVFIFQAGSTVIGAANIVLIGRANPANVYWVAGSSVTLNSSAWQGNIVAYTTIELKVNTSLLGRALARNGSVTLDASHNVITLP